MGLVIGLLALGIICIIIYMLSKNIFYWADWVEATSFVLAMLFITIGIGFASAAIIVVIEEDIVYEQTQYEREQLIVQYEEGNQYAYDQIIKFDKDLYEIKYWGKTFWFSWLYNQRIVNEVDYIFYEER